MTVPEARSFMNRHNVTVSIGILALCCGLAIFHFRDSFKNSPRHEKKGAADYVRYPFPYHENSSHTYRVVQPLDPGPIRFEMPQTNASTVEVGLIRTGKSKASSEKSRFLVYRKNWLRKEILVDAMPELEVNEHASYRFQQKGPSKGNSPDQIYYEIVAEEKQDAANGGDAYKEFSFVVPTAFDKRKADDLNVILISYDTLRPDHLGCYGYKRNTSPNIDAFAKRSLMFKQAISSTSWTGPAHYSLFTSLYPRTIAGWKEEWKGLEDWVAFKVLFSQKTLAETLRENGYYTAAFTGGGTLTSKFGFASGFNRYWETTTLGAYSSQVGTVRDDTEHTFDAAFDWLEDNRDTKFFIFLHTFECHHPYQGTFFVSPDVTDNLIEHRIALYDSAIRTADAYFGELMQKLESLDLMKNTMIIFLSDHGEDFYDHYAESDVIPPLTEQTIPEISRVAHTHSLYEELIRIPLIINVPGLQSQGRVIENQVRLIDIAPTILEILGVKFGAPFQGTSLVEVMKTGKRNVEPPAVSEWNRIGPQRRAVRKGGYKYIWIENPDIYKDRTFKDIQQYELFDLKNDPGEKNNIYALNRGLAREYHKILEQHLKETGRIRKTLRGDSFKPGNENNQIDEDVIEKLKGLGYIE